MFAKWPLVAALIVFSGLGAGVHHLYQQRQLNGKNLEIPSGKRKLELGKDKRDDDKWRRKISLYIGNSFLDGFEKIEEGENVEERNIAAMKNACDVLLRKRYVKDEIEDKQMQAEKWCFTNKETVGDMLFTKIENGQILIFEGKDEKDKNEFDKRIEQYREEYGNEIVEFHNGGKIEMLKLSDLKDKFGLEESNKKIKELIRGDCLGLWDSEWNEKNEAAFRKWCMREVVKEKRE